MHPGRIRWAQIASNLGRPDTGALGIVGLLSFLLGIVIAYQGGVQLRQYGASLFVADLVGLSMVRELAPLITAIIVAGRTGSAYTAQIGTMQVTEEVDALRSMGNTTDGSVGAAQAVCPHRGVAAAHGIRRHHGCARRHADVERAAGDCVFDLSSIVSAWRSRWTLPGWRGQAPVFAAIIATIGCYQGFRWSAARKASVAAPR